MASSIFSVAWVKGAGERALKSFAQGALVGLGISTVTTGTDVPEILALPWAAALSTGLSMAALSIMTSIAQPEFTAGTPPEPALTVPDDSLDTDDVDEDEEELEEEDAELEPTTT
jgi:hypothetical protein